MTKPSLQEVQDLMIRLWSNTKDFETFKATGELPGVPKELLAGLDAERVGMYHRDVMSRRMRFTKAGYALTLRVLEDNKTKVVDQYWQEYGSSHFCPFESRGTFPEFLRSQPDLMSKFPYLADLAAYEWFRRTASENGDEFERGQGIDLSSEEKRKQFSPITNPSVIAHKFDYPVDRIAKRTAGGRWRHHRYKVEEYYLVAYQDPEDREEVRVQEVGEVAYVLVENAKSHAMSFDQLIRLAIDLIPEQSAEETTEDVIVMLEQFERCGIFLGQRSLAGKEPSSQVPHTNRVR